MATTNRPALIKKIHRVLKQHYKPVPAEPRPLLEQLLFACCLENTPYPLAEKTYTHLRSAFFDWNEVRVSTVTELAEALSALPNPTAAATNVKRVLQGVFETTYSFDLEQLKKGNIGVGIKKLEKLQGSAAFVVAYGTQTALGGHSIPLDLAARETLYVLGVATEKEAHSGVVAGLERAIPKNKGIEFGSLLHQLAAEFHGNPQSPNVRKVLLSIAADAKDRFPKRGAKILPPVKEPVKKHAAQPVAPPAASKKGAPAPAKKAPEKKRAPAKPEPKAAHGRKPTKRPTKQLAKRKPR